MKRKLSLLVFIMIIIVTALVCEKVQASTSDEVIYRISDGKASVVGLSDPTYSGTITIPGEINGNKVVSVEEGAFKNNDNLKGIVFSEGLETIGDNSFYGCSSLETIVLPKSLNAVGSKCFGFCRNLDSVYFNGNGADWCGISFRNEEANPLAFTKDFYFEGERITDLVIPSGPTEIKAYAFNCLESLKSITLPDTITEIGAYAFHYCYGLERITIPVSVTDFKSEAFRYCSNLTATYYLGNMKDWCSIHFDGKGSNPLISSKYLYIDNQPVIDAVIPDNVEVVGAYSFCNYESLRSVNISEGVRIIDEYAFVDCFGLETVRIPKSIRGFYGHAFHFMSNLESVYYNGDAGDWCKIYFRDPEANPLTYTKYFYIGNNRITDLEIPEGPTEISSFAFCYLESLKSVSIPLSVTKIDTYAFFYSDNITDVYYPSTAVEYGNIEICDCNNPLLSAVKHFGYRLAWIIDGDTYSISSQQAGETIIPPVISEKIGFTFSGWSPSVPDKMPANNLSFTGSFLANTYTVSFVADGTTIYTVEYKYGDKSVEEPSVPEKEGFSGKWSSYSLGASNITVNALYTCKTTLTAPAGKTVDYRNKVNITFTANHLSPSCYIAINDKKGQVAKGDMGQNNIVFISEELTDNNTYTANVYDYEGNKVVGENGRIISKSVQIDVNKGFFQIIIAFFRGLFGNQPTIVL